MTTIITLTNIVCDFQRYIKHTTTDICITKPIFLSGDTILNQCGILFFKEVYINNYSTIVVRNLVCFSEFVCFLNIFLK